MHSWRRFGGADAKPAVSKRYSYAHTSRFPYVSCEPHRNTDECTTERAIGQYWLLSNLCHLYICTIWSFGSAPSTVQYHLNASYRRFRQPVTMNVATKSTAAVRRWTATHRSFSLLQPSSSSSSSSLRIRSLSTKEATNKAGGIGLHNVQDRKLMVLLLLNCFF